MARMISSDTGKHPKAQYYDDAAFQAFLVFFVIMGVVIALFILAFL